MANKPKSPKEQEISDLEERLTRQGKDALRQELVGQAVHNQAQRAQAEKTWAEIRPKTTPSPRDWEALGSPIVDPEKELAAAKRNRARSQNIPSPMELEDPFPQLQDPKIKLNKGIFKSKEAKQKDQELANQKKWQSVAANEQELVGRKKNANSISKKLGNLAANIGAGIRKLSSPKRSRSESLLDQSQEMSSPKPKKSIFGRKPSGWSQER